MIIFFLQGETVAELDVAEVVAELGPALNAQSLAALTVATEAELYEWADEHAQRLARKIGCFVERSGSLTIAAGSSTVNKPARHLSTLHFSRDHDGAGDLRPLEATSTAELEALDLDWETRVADEDAGEFPKRFTEDQQPAGVVRVHPAPESETTAAIVYHQYPAAIAAGSPAIQAPRILGDYLFWAMLGEARRRESDEAMPEVAAFSEQMVELYEQVFERYWGQAQ